MLNWIARNRTVLISKLCTYAKLNYLKKMSAGAVEYTSTEG